MRGTGRTECIPPAVVGIIPAYAGNSAKSVSVSNGSRDHPRVCREQRRAIPQARSARGSSPRMRGTVLRLLVALRVAGIIPAYAGNRQVSTRRGGQARDHPRVCGEQNLFAVKACVHVGSSPRMRGTVEQFKAAWQTDGIIPAYAGNRTRPRWG